ncbi:MAG: TMEM165/GDT1 family protein [Stellaceae bacterium]
MWALFPDKYQGGAVATRRAGAFTPTFVAVFLAEIGDKTQIATIGLAARFEAFYPVVLGTTLGMMLANIPAVLIGGDRKQTADKGHPLYSRHRVRRARLSLSPAFADRAG